MKLTHINQQGRAQMVDVSNKTITKRVAKAQSIITMQSETLKRILKGDIHKGDVLAVAQVAGIQAAKATHTLIPMCHPLQLSHIDIAFIEDLETSSLTITSTVITEGKTGVEMEALTAVSVAALTIYDMAKSIDREMRIDNTYLVEKSGGQSGHYQRLDNKEDHHG